MVPIEASGRKTHVFFSYRNSRFLTAKIPLLHSCSQLFTVDAAADNLRNWPLLAVKLLIELQFLLSLVATLELLLLLLLRGWDAWKHL